MAIQLTVLNAVDGVKDVGHGGVGGGGNAAKKNKTGFHGGWLAFLSFCVLLLCCGVCGVELCCQLN